MDQQQDVNRTRALGVLLSDPRRASELRMCRIIAVAWALTFWGLAALAFASGHFFGHTKQGHEISLDGPPALAMGVFEVALGSVMLAFFARTSRTALLWMLGWFAVGAAAVGAAIALR